MTPRPTSDPPLLSATAIVRATVRAAGALATRQLVGQALNAAGAVALANLLTIEDFGIYAIVVLAWSILYVLSDVGLGAALVRQGHEPDLDDYRGVFTAQQLLMLAAVAVAWPLAPLLAAPYARADDISFVIRMAALALIPGSFQTIPSVRLERHLRFDRLAAVEVGQALVFNATAVTLAWLGKGASLSLGVALVARTVTGAILAHAASPWPIGWHWSWPRVREHLAFGVPFQGVSMVSLLKDAFVPVVVGMLLGEATVGMLTWAQWIARAPVLPLFMMQRVYLPAFSRMLDHRAELGRFIENVLFTANAAVAPTAIIVVLVADRLPLLFFGEQWQSAVPYVYPYWLSTLALATAFPLFGLLGALGQARVAFVLAAIQTIITWCVGPPLAYAFGPMGAACVALLGAPAIAAAVPIARSHVPFAVAPAILAPWTAAGVAGAALWMLEHRWPITTIAALVLCSLATLAVYAVVLAALAPQRARAMLALAGAARKRQPSASE